MSVSLLAADGLSKAFPVRRSFAGAVARQERLRVVALDDVSVDVAPGETVAVVGESGSGKSTLAKCIVRLIEPDSGTITFNGSKVQGAKREGLRRFRRAVQMVYQDPYSSLNPRMTIGAAISEPARVHGLVPQHRLDEHVRELLFRVGLQAGDAKRRPRELSGGQRQRVAIARALSLSPKVLIADEATSALDVSMQGQILNLFDDLQRDLGLGMILISHQLAVVARLAQRVFVMYLGRVVESGTVEQIFDDSHHPYTQGLLRAHPSIEISRRTLKLAVSGEPPSPLALPSGCRFRTRCPLAQPICSQVEPPPVEVRPGHVSRCHVLAPKPANSSAHAQAKAQ
jgi:oligopeptide transport system ATP-binding protein